MMDNRQYIRELEDRGYKAAEVIRELKSERNTLLEINDALNLRLIGLEAIASMHKMLDKG